MNSLLLLPDEQCSDKPSGLAVPRPGAGHGEAFDLGATGNAQSGSRTVSNKPNHATAFDDDNDWSLFDSTLIDLTGPTPLISQSMRRQTATHRRIALVTGSVVLLFIAASAWLLTANGNAAKSETPKRKVLVITGSQSSDGPVPTPAPVDVVAPVQTLPRTKVPRTTIQRTTIQRTTVPRTTRVRTTKVRTSKLPSVAVPPTDGPIPASPIRNKSLSITERSQGATSKCTGRPASSTPISDIEQTFLLKLNAFRVERGLPPLIFSNELADAARTWSKTMATTGLAHEPNLLQVMQIRAGRAGENVGFGPDVDTLHQAFLESAPHLRNLLEPAFQTVAFGATVYNGSIWVTVRFADAEAMNPCNYLA